MKRLTSFILAAGLVLAPPLLAQDRPVVVELFTSQGCSSCPPADEILAELSKRDDVIALALHVDYWDYIGWKDRFGDPNHAARQRAYAAAAGRKSVYTPEMIVNGTTDVVGAKPMAVSQAIARHKNDPSQIDLTLLRSDETLQIAATARAGTAGKYTVHMLRYTPAATTQIERGENAGHTFQYHNIAQNWTVLGDWDAAKPLSISTKITGELPVVVIIQHSGAGPIAAAARLK